MNAVFTYGTLMCADIMHRVAGSYDEACSAVLADHRRLCVRGETYPGLVPADGHAVEGLLYTGVTGAGLARLDAFEGEEYERITADVTGDGGTSVRAYTYLFRDAYRERLTDEEWDFERFLAEGRERFLKSYGGFHGI